MRPLIAVNCPGVLLAGALSALLAAASSPLVAALAAGEAGDSDPPAALVQAPGVAVVEANCTGCHSAALITGSRATREGWLTMIRWMQDTQGLWPLGANEDVILNYLAETYGPVSADGPGFSGRRPPVAQSLMPGPDNPDR
jgi:hypothetical protein